MRAVIKGAVLTALLAGSTIAGTAPAEARDRTGVAIAAGIIGLGIGAAIASDHRGYERADYGYDYAPSGYYVESPTYYGGGYSYSRPYYSGGYGYDRGYRGHDRDHWDGRRGHDRDRHDRGDWDRNRR
jgi:hypothetical protein